MEVNSFFDEVEQHFKDQLPLVVYQKPNSKEFKAWLQTKSDVRFSEGFTEEGFVFSPYKGDRVVIFKKSDCRFITSANTLPSVQFSVSKKSQRSQEAKQAYVALVEGAISKIKSSELSKVVVSRVVDVEHIDKTPLAIFKELVQAYPNAFVYCWFHPKVGLWLGATPELLLSLKRNQLTTVSLAGTLNMSDNAEWSPKEIYEQEVVTNFIVSQLQPFSNEVKAGATVEVKAGKLRHLKTEIRARLNVGKSDLNLIISKLHPTPAVCGFPKALAQSFIESNENYQRSYYTGFLGEINGLVEQSRTSEGKNTENKAFKVLVKQSQLYVNLRCMQLLANRARIYVGGGIVESSVPEKEWQETVDKSHTMMRVL